MLTIVKFCDYPLPMEFRGPLMIQGIVENALNWEMVEWIRVTNRVTR